MVLDGKRILAQLKFQRCIQDRFELINLISFNGLVSKHQFQMSLGLAFFFLFWLQISFGLFILFLKAYLTSEVESHSKKKLRGNMCDVMNSTAAQNEWISVVLSSLFYSPQFKILSMAIMNSLC